MASHLASLDSYSVSISAFRLPLRDFVRFSCYLLPSLLQENICRYVEALSLAAHRDFAPNDTFLTRRHVSITF